MINKNYIAEIMEGRVEDAKAKIIKAGLEIFSDSSLKAARTREIAALAGVNHAAISYYFGGKEELYLEIANQIIEFIAAYTKPFFERAEEVYKTKSAKDARELMADFAMSRICPESDMNDTLRHIILVITREELSRRTGAIEVFFEKTFAPSLQMMSKLTEIASEGKYSGEKACIVSEMLIGQIHLFNSARSGLKKINGWESFDHEEIRKVRVTYAELLDKIFNK